MAVASLSPANFFSNGELTTALLFLQVAHRRPPTSPLFSHHVQVTEEPLSDVLLSRTTVLPSSPETMPKCHRATIEPPPLVSHRAKLLPSTF
jgi:hypothetical protein